VKFIRKGRKPAALARFERKNAATPQAATYAGLAPETRRALVKKMLEEQGRLCAYTMRCIGVSTDARDYHIEHIRPRSRCPELQIEYKNMLLCAPGGGCDWGARCKDEADVDEANFVSPLNETCETRFEYRRDGFVRASEENDAAAASTLNLLNLNHKELVAERGEAMRRFGLGPNAQKALSAQKAERLGARICERNLDGSFEPFCIAIRQAAERIARRARERSARLRTAR